MGVICGSGVMTELRHTQVDQHTGTDGVLLVHCRLGNGRSGVYVAIDHLIKEGKEGSQVDIFKCVTKLRLERPQLILTAAQYRSEIENKTQKKKKKKV